LYVAISIYSFEDMHAPFTTMADLWLPEMNNAFIAFLHSLTKMVLLVTLMGKFKRDVTRLVVFK
jgi:hypothetical protein